MLAVLRNRNETISKCTRRPQTGTLATLGEHAHRGEMRTHCESNMQIFRTSSSVVIFLARLHLRSPQGQPLTTHCRVSRDGAHHLSNTEIKKQNLLLWPWPYSTTMFLQVARFWNWQNSKLLGFLFLFSLFLSLNLTLKILLWNISPETYTKLQHNPAQLLLITNQYGREHTCLCEAELAKKTSSKGEGNQFS